MEGIGQKLARHGTAAKAGRGEAADDPEAAPRGHAADQRLAVERERHQARPGARGGLRLEEGQDLRRVSVIHLDAGGLGRRAPPGELTVPAEDDLAISALPAVEMARDARAVAVREVRRLVLAPGARGQRATTIVAPGEAGLGRRDRLKDTRRQRRGRPHLAAHGDDRDVETEHRPDGTAPGARRDDEVLGNDLCPRGPDHPATRWPRRDRGHFVMGEDAGALPLGDPREGPRGPLRIGLGAQRR